jgi:hypothetical protein
MNFNLDGIGRRVAIIKGANDKYKKKVLAIHDEDKGEDAKVSKSFTKLELPDNLNFQLIPNPNIEREILYVTGSSGSGKSYFIKEYVKEYKKKFKDRPIYLFSYLDEDETLDQVNPTRINVGDNLLTDPIKAQDLKDSFVIFDDCDCIKDKKHREAVLSIMNECLQTGRHFNITMACVSHLPTDKNFTRMIINESHYVIYFPSSGLGRQTKYLLTDYLGMDNKLIKKIRRMKTRWCCVSRNYPLFIMTQHCVSMRDEYDSDSDNDDEELYSKSNIKKKVD